MSGILPTDESFKKWPVPLRYLKSNYSTNQADEYLKKFMDAGSNLRLMQDGSKIVVFFQIIFNILQPLLRQQHYWSAESVCRRFFALRTLSTMLTRRRRIGCKWIEKKNLGTSCRFKKLWTMKIDTEGKKVIQIIII